MPMYATAWLLIPSMFHSYQTLQSEPMLGTEMHPSSAISFEPGLERGVPWGRDLITFMTSAAGYMMRTLQKPRKNKPSKRQVNHRRFLHNMIQRKFAEIEAANHQLASALFSVDTGSERQSEGKLTHQNESDKSLKKATVVFGAVETNQLDEENDTRTVDRPVIDPNESALMSKSLSNLAGKANQIKEDGEWGEHSGEISPQEISGKKEQIHWAPVDLSDLPPITNLILEDSILTSLETTERITENSHIAISNSPDGEQEQQQEQQHLGLTLFDLSPTSPVSPLSLNSCDFEVQIQPDNDHISQIQQTAECLQMDLMENLELLDSEEYIQKIDQMDMAAVWDVHGDEDMSCFQDCFPFFNASHVDFTMDKQATCGDGDICGGLQQFTTLLENSVKSMNVEDELRSNIMYSLSDCGSSGHNNQAKQTRVTTDCYINDPQISTAVSKEGQCSISGTWTVSEHGNISGHALQELKRDLLDQSQSKNWEQHLTHNDHAPSQVKDRYYTLRDEEEKMIESGSTLNPNLEHSSPVNLISSTMEHCYGFDVPLEADGSNLFSNNRGNQSISSFEGVAQYFPAPHQNSHPRPVSTPPLNDDWLFSNISTEVDF